MSQWDVLAFIIVWLVDLLTILDQHPVDHRHRTLPPREDWSFVFPWNHRRDHVIESLHMNAHTGLICTSHARYGQSLWFFLPGSLLLPQNPIYRSRESRYLWVADLSHQQLYIYQSEAQLLERYEREWSTYRWTLREQVQHNCLNRLLWSSTDSLLHVQQKRKWCRLTENNRTCQPVIFSHVRPRQHVIPSDTTGLEDVLVTLKVDTGLLIDVHHKQSLMATYKLQQFTPLQACVHDPRIGWWVSCPVKGWVMRLHEPMNQIGSPKKVYVYPPVHVSCRFGSSLLLGYPWLWVSSDRQWHLYQWLERRQRFRWLTSIHLPWYTTEHETLSVGTTNERGDLLASNKHRVYFWKNVFCL